MRPISYPEDRLPPARLAPMGLQHVIAMFGATVLALEVPADDLSHWLWLTGARATGLIAIELWDADAWH